MDEKNQTATPETVQDEGQIKAVRLDKLKALVDAGNNPFAITTFDKTHAAADILNNAEQMLDQPVRVAGRMIAKRVMGKA